MISYRSLLYNTTVLYDNLQMETFAHTYHTTHSAVMDRDTHSTYTTHHKCAYCYNVYTVYVLCVSDIRFNAVKPKVITEEIILGFHIPIPHSRAFGWANVWRITKLKVSGKKFGKWIKFDHKDTNKRYY